jgi:arylsulfatase A-like enzyme
MFTGRIRLMVAGLGLALLAMLGAASAGADQRAVAAPPAPESNRPNILLVILDDIGFTDLGAYGSEIRTPNFDAEAARGTMLTNFHVAPTCVPSRAMLLTGVDSHRTGLPTLEHLMLPEHLGQPGYEGELNTRVATIAEHLGAAGYTSFITGKWHLGRSATSLPAARGFARSFVLDSSGADNWEHRPYLPLYTRAEWWEDLAYVDTLPEDFYSSRFIVDRMISYLSEADKAEPFLSVVSFQANHIPVQAPREYVERYNGVYDAGWEALAKRRHGAAIERGLVPADTPVPAFPQGLRSWSDLSAEDRAAAAMNRQVAAGMLEAADHHFGRLVSWLRETGRYDNTIVLIISDNGPEYNNPGRLMSFRGWLSMQGYSRDLDSLGERGTYAWIGPEWAAASASPLSFFKFHAGEGGLRVPFIAAGPGVKAGHKSQALSFATDLAPGLLDFAGASPVQGVEAFSGRSLAPLLRGQAERIHGESDAVGMEMSGQSALFRGDYKLARIMRPYGDGQWRLFDIVNDPGEARDLAGERAELFTEMMADYEAYEKRFGVLPVPPDFDGERRVELLGWLAFARNYGLWLALSFVLVGGLLALAIRRVRRRKS